MRSMQWCKGSSAFLVAQHRPGEHPEGQRWQGQRWGCSFAALGQAHLSAAYCG